MQSSVRARAGAVPVAVLAVAWLVLAGPASAGPVRGDRPQEKAAQAPAQAEYAGSETCVTCHEDKGNAIKTGAHSRAFNSRTPVATQGCESCHGPGKAHAEAGGDKTKIKVISKLGAHEVNQVCTTCHDRTKHALWAGSQHEQRNVACTSCHSVHAAKGDPQLKAASEVELCGTCHRPITNKTNRYNHMPVREGKMQCSSCHNVHGTTNVRLLKVGTTIDESCTSCHSEKRGPYLWEHAAVVEACVTCHDPHGSNNDRMLVAKQPFLCQRCHVTSRHPPTVYDGFILQNSSNANKIYSRSCVVCHQMIHGSNAPSGEFFLR